MKTIQKSAFGVAVMGAGAVMLLNSPIIAQTGSERTARNNQNERNHRDDRNEHGGPRERNDGNNRGRRNDGEDFGPRGERPPHPPGPSVEQLDEIADLTPEQEKKVAAALDNLHTQMRRLHETTRQEIDSILTAEQHQKLQQMHERMGPPEGPPGRHDGRREGADGPRRGEGGPRRGEGFGPPPRDGFAPPPAEED